MTPLGSRGGWLLVLPRARGRVPLPAGSLGWELAFPAGETPQRSDKGMGVRVPPFVLGSWCTRLRRQKPLNARLAGGWSGINAPRGLRPRRGPFLGGGKSDKVPPPFPARPQGSWQVPLGEGGGWIQEGIPAAPLCGVAGGQRALLVAELGLLEGWGAGSAPAGKSGRLLGLFLGQGAGNDAVCVSCRDRSSPNPSPTEDVSPAGAATARPPAWGFVAFYLTPGEEKVSAISAATRRLGRGMGVPPEGEKLSWGLSWGPAAETRAGFADGWPCWGWCSIPGELPPPKRFCPWSSPRLARGYRSLSARTALSSIHQGAFAVI